MVARRDERITRLALGSVNRSGRLKSGTDAPSLVEAIPLEAIDPDPSQPRRQFDRDKLQLLADSLTAHGQLQPIIVLRTEDRYTLLIGERRWRASQFAGLSTIRAIVRETPLDARTTLVLQIVENEQRDALAVSELIDGVRRLSALGLKNVEIAGALGKSPTRISELQALADAPDALGRIIDAIGLGLSYQLLRQWRAHPNATLDFLDHMPIEHISRITIATIGQASAATPSSSEAGPMPRVRTPAGAPVDGTGGVGEGASPRIQVPTVRPLPADALLSLPAEPSSTMGALLVEHDVHGAGRVAFGLDVPVDHLAVRFVDEAPIVVHKDELRLLGTIAFSGIED
jgi:ParB family chromosome partitioning protein